MAEIHWFELNSAPCGCARGASWNFLGIQTGVQNRFYDFDQASSNIVVIAIDERTLAENGLGPLSQWQRNYYRVAIETLLNAGAQVVGLDVTLPNASVNGPEDEARLADLLSVITT
ncbi:CHASE2 domain-containing protein [Candidatus Peregrinibacteria bacterium]|nr:MAG: CHASE2 domain-containing protein [Candidatus Peregrinibacteria bacterium]